MSIQYSRGLRIWLLPFALLTVVAATVFMVSIVADTRGDLEWMRLLLHPNPNSAENVVINSADVFAALFGIVVTVVAIIVELAANRYTHRITELFVHEPVNFFVMGFFVVAALHGLFVGVIFDVDGLQASGFVPYTAIAVVNAMLIFGMLILLPYFAFVFDFLNPINIVDRIRKHTMKVFKKNHLHHIHAMKEEAVRGIEQLADISLNAMEQKDKGVSMASVNALEQMVLDYQPVRKKMPEVWFDIEGNLARNPDFVSMSSGVLDSVTHRRIWFEMKIFRKYQTLYNEALNKMRDINYMIAIHTRRIAEHALENNHIELFDLSIKFFNTYLRATINAKDVRTAYNVLHQYRLIAESALRYQDGARAIEVARYFKYYGLLSFQTNLPFILETAAYDLCVLNELAFDLDSPSALEILKIFLQVDKEGESTIHETSLRGVRKAQVKLATYYLLKNKEALAREVWKDMEDERTERLVSIRDELMSVSSSEFWEVSDRGQNFDYLSPERKVKMVEFFSWFKSGT